MREREGEKEGGREREGGSGLFVDGRRGRTEGRMWGDACVRQAGGRGVPRVSKWKGERGRELQAGGRGVPRVSTRERKRGSELQAGGRGVPRVNR